MYVIPTASTDALEQARIDAQEFANTVNEASQSLIDVTDVPGSNEAVETSDVAPSEMIEVTDVPGYEGAVEVKHEATTQEQRELGHAAVEGSRKSFTIENPSAHTLRTAIGSPYYQDRLGRLAPKEDEK